MRFIQYIPFLLIFSSLLQCTGQPPEHRNEEALRDSVMVVHDEVMPGMSEIHRVKRELKKLFESETPLDSLEIKRVEEAISFLEKADDGMMNWMAEFRQPGSLRSSMSHEEIMIYLEDEMGKIAKVKVDMLESIKSGQDLLNQLQSK